MTGARRSFSPETFHLNYNPPPTPIHRNETLEVRVETLIVPDVTAEFLLGPHLPVQLSFSIERLS